MKVLVVDIGGTSVKMLATGETEPRKFPSGPAMTAKQMVAGVKEATKDWEYDVVTVGYPGAVVQNRPVAEPHNLAPGWVGFDYRSEFGLPVKVINDAAMQALGSYRGGKLLFLGLGTGLGTTFIVDGLVEPMELGHLPYRKATYEDYVGQRGLDRLGKKKWRERVADVVARMVAALEPTDLVIGGGNVAKLAELPPGARLGDNANAFVGGFRLWKDAPRPRPRASAGQSTKSRASATKSVEPKQHAPAGKAVKTKPQTRTGNAIESKPGTPVGQRIKLTPAAPAAKSVKPKRRKPADKAAMPPRSPAKTPRKR